MGPRKYFLCGYLVCAYADDQLAQDTQNKFYKLEADIESQSHLNVSKNEEILEKISHEESKSSVSELPDKDKFTCDSSQSEKLTQSDEESTSKKSEAGFFAYIWRLIKKILSIFS